MQIEFHRSLISLNGIFSLGSVACASSEAEGEAASRLFFVSISSDIDISLFLVFFISLDVVVCSLFARCLIVRLLVVLLVDYDFIFLVSLIITDSYNNISVR